MDQIILHIAALLSDRVDWPDSTLDFDRGYEKARSDIANDLCEAFANVPGFDSDLFMTACSAKIES